MIEVYMIWAMLDSEPEDPWLIEAWDEFSIDNNFDGWNEAIAKAKKENKNIRITKSWIDYKSVVKAFAPAPVELSAIMEVEQ